MKKVPFTYEDCKVKDDDGEYVRVKPGNFLLPATIRDYGEEIYNMELREGDVILLSWPKTGTHWCSELIWNICNDMNIEEAKSKSMLDRWRFIDVPSDKKKHVCALELTDKPMGRIEKLLDVEGPRYIISHLPLSLFPPDTLDKCKVVYVTRNPMDTIVSLYRFLELRPDENTDFPTFVNNFMHDEVVFSPYWEHVGEAWKLKEHSNLFFLTFEEMKKDLRATIKNVAKFFNKEFSIEQIDTLVDHLSFENMQSNKSVNAEYLNKTGKIKQGGQFIRKGAVGDFKNSFTPAMQSQMKNWIQTNNRGCDIKFQGVAM
nr:sulfotransferase 2 [Vargula tsujii]